MISEKNLRRPLRIVILTSPHHLYGNYMVKHLLKRTDICEICGVIESTVLLPRMKYHRALWKYYKTAGTYFFFIQSFKGLFFRTACFLHRLLNISNVDSPFLSFERILEKRSIPVFATDDINSESAKDFIVSRNPDLMVILLFAQVLKRDVIEIAPHGCINFHPSFLPEYRGLMPVFWALADGKTDAGVTIHHVDEGIDTGAIIDQEKIPITPTDTEHSLYARICTIGAKKMARAIEDLRDEKESARAQPENVESCYRSVPTSESVSAYRKRGRRFYSVGQLLRPFEPH